MTANRFFLPEACSPEERVWVEGQEHHHLRRVARVRKGDRVAFFDGQGEVYEAVVESSGPDRTLVRILSRERALPPRTAITLALALLKSHALEAVIRGATELVVSTLAFVVTERSVVKSSILPPSRLLRWEHIAREASKQSKTGLLPEIRPPQALDGFLRQDVSARKIFLCERGGTLLRDVVTEGAGSSFAPPASISVLVGPEGGWSADEERRIREWGYLPVTLGRSVLRAETAALCALGLLSHFWVT